MFIIDPFPWVYDSINIYKKDPISCYIFTPIHNYLTQLHQYIVEKYNISYEVDVNFNLETIGIQNSKSLSQLVFFDYYIKKDIDICENYLMMFIEEFKSCLNINIHYTFGVCVNKTIFHVICEKDEKLAIFLLESGIANPYIHYKVDNLKGWYIDTKSNALDYAISSHNMKLVDTLITKYGMKLKYRHISNLLNNISLKKYDNCLEYQKNDLNDVFNYIWYRCHNKDSITMTNEDRHDLIVLMHNACIYYALYDRYEIIYLLIKNIEKHHFVYESLNKDKSLILSYVSSFNICRHFYVNDPLQNCYFKRLDISLIEVFIEKGVNLNINDKNDKNGKNIIDYILEFRQDIYTYAESKGINDYKGKDIIQTLLDLCFRNNINKCNIYQDICNNIYNIWYNMKLKELIDITQSIPDVIPYDIKKEITLISICMNHGIINGY